MGSSSLASEWCLHAQVTAASGGFQGLGYRSARLSMPPATEGLAFVVKLRGTGSLFAPEDGGWDARAGTLFYRVD
jgi:hypothetical protein